MCNGWISVQDALPECNIPRRVGNHISYFSCEVLVADVHGNVGIGYFHKGYHTRLKDDLGWRCFSNLNPRTEYSDSTWYEYSKYITHWMQFPKHPVIT